MALALTVMHLLLGPEPVSIMTESALSRSPVITRSTSPAMVAISLVSWPTLESLTLSTKDLLLNPLTVTSLIEGTLRYVCRRVWTANAVKSVFLTLSEQERYSSERMTLYSNLNLWGQSVNDASLSVKLKVTVTDPSSELLDSRVHCEVRAKPCCGILFSGCPNCGKTTGIPMNWISRFKKHFCMLGTETALLTSPDSFDTIEKSSWTDENVFCSVLIHPTCEGSSEEVNICRRFWNTVGEVNLRQTIYPYHSSGSPHLKTEQRRKDGAGEPS